MWLDISNRVLCFILFDIKKGMIDYITTKIINGLKDNIA